MNHNLGASTRIKSQQMLGEHIEYCNDSTYLKLKAKVRIYSVTVYYKENEAVDHKKIHDSSSLHGECG